MNKRLISVLLTLSITLTTVSSFFVVSAKEDVQNVSQTAIKGWSNELSTNTIYSLDFATASVNGKRLSNETTEVVLESKDKLSFTLDIIQKDKYYFYIKYYSKEALFTDCLFELGINDTQSIVSLPLLWKDASSEYSKDKYGNELLPDQAMIAEPYFNMFCDYASSNKDIALFELEKGSYNINITPQSQAVMICEIHIKRYEDAPVYKDYISGYKNKKVNSTAIIEAEKYSLKSDSFIMAKPVRNSALYPYDSKHKKINVLNGENFSSTGQKVLWEFEVKEEGLYGIALRYNQNVAINMPVYRRLEIDGRLPFKEAEAVKFPNSPTGKYDNIILNIDGEELLIYLAPGKHTIALTATIGPLEEAYDAINILMEDINTLGNDLQRLTAGQTDTNRTWNLEYYLPNAINDILSFADRTEEIYNLLEKIGGKTPSYASSLKFAAERLRRLVNTPNKIPAKLDMLNVGDDSAAKYLGNIMNTLSGSSLGIDRIYIGKTEDLPSAKSSFWKSLIESIQSFLLSFTSYYTTGDSSAETKSNDNLQVWINGSAQYVDTLQRLIDEQYNPDNSTNIRLSIMQGESKLILSNATGTNPDVVLHTDMQTPFKFAIRNAAKNMLEYDDFLTFCNANFNLQSLVPLTYGEGVYGIPETQDYNVLFYRKDILDSLGLSVPDTWEDVKQMMPTLLRYGKNFCIPLSGTAALKGFASTSPYVFQNNASYIKENGLTAQFDSEQFIDALTEMTELFTIYGIQTAVPSFYNGFRTGEIPIGISSYATYMQLQVTAPELANKWGIALSPGTIQEDGTVARYQSAATAACMIFDNTKKDEESWKFLKWWLSTETQITYAYKLLNTYGSEYYWNTANLNAFEQLSYPKDDKATIIEQLCAQKEITNHPANYMVERQVSEIWNGVVVDNEPLIEEIDRAITSTNYEITRKLKEFGFYDNSGKLVKEYSMNAYKTLQTKLEEAQKKGDS